MATHRSVTRDMPKLSLRASFEPASVNEEKRTVQVTWTTGAAVLRGYGMRYYEELSLDPKHVRMGRLQSGAAPLLNSHNSYDIADVIGVVEDAKLSKNGGTATVRFDSGAAGEDAFRKVREGILRNISVGYSTYRMEKVEGGDATIPTYRAVDWEPAELSMVPIGADAGAVTRSGGATTPCEFIQEREMPEPIETENKPTLTSTVAPALSESVRAATEAATQAAVKLAEEKETERVLGIQRIGRRLNRPESEIGAAIAKRTSLDAFRTAAVDALSDVDTKPENGGVISFGRISAGDDARDKFRNGATAWLLQRASLAGMVADSAKVRGEKLDLDPGEFRGSSLLDLAKESLKRSGVETRGMTKMDLIGLAFTHRGSGMNTTSDFGVLLENVQGKILLARYLTTRDTFSSFCRVGTVVDFRPSPRYRQGSFGKLDKLKEGGEFVHKSIPDGEKQSISADTVGNIIAISRKTIINDDMSAFTGLPLDLARAAKLSIELDFYILLALNGGLGPLMSDGLTMFHATHKNLPAGAALSAANLDLDRIALGAQTDVTGNEVLDLKPYSMLISNMLGGQARVINDSNVDPDTLANKAQGKSNIAGKMFNEIIDTARLAGTRRYIFADPSTNPVFEVAYLDGVQNPYLETQVGFDVDGVKWKVRHDYVVGAIDFRGAVTNAGV